MDGYAFWQHWLGPYLSLGAMAASCTPLSPSLPLLTTFIPKSPDKGGEREKERARERER